MQNSFLIWIPSIQNQLRFRELTVDQYRCILKILDDKPIEFCYNLNQIIKDNLVDQFDYRKLTTFDRFVIFIGLKIHSCRTIISLSRKCEKCQTMAGIKLNLDTLLDIIAPKLDRSFQTPINFSAYSVMCDLPTIDTEYQINQFNALHNIRRDDIDANYDSYLMSHITSIQVSDTAVIDLASSQFRHIDRVKIVNKLPLGLINNIQNDFLTPIHKIVTDIDFLKIDCPNSKCNEKFEILFNITNINEIIKTIYRDDSIENLLNSISHLKVDASYLAVITPRELDILVDQLKKSNASEQEPDPTQPPKPKDLLAEYASHTAGMQESPSEFS